MAISANARNLVEGFHDWKIRIWNAESRTVVGNPLYGDGNKSVHRVEVFAVGRKVISGHSYGKLRMWDVE